MYDHARGVKRAWSVLNYKYSVEGLASDVYVRADGAKYTRCR